VELIMKKLLTKSAILDADDLKHEDVDVPQWGGTVRVRTMTGAERDEFRNSVNAEGGVGVGRFAVALLAATLIDESGARLFTMDDIDQLAEKSATSIDKPAAMAMRLNGLGGAAVEESVKNSASGQSDDSGSGSPLPSAPLLENSKPE
jgi:phage-related tail fiber protein